MTPITPITCSLLFTGLKSEIMLDSIFTLDSGNERIVYVIIQHLPSHFDFNTEIQLYAFHVCMYRLYLCMYTCMRTQHILGTSHLHNIISPVHP